MNIRLIVCVFIVMTIVHQISGSRKNRYHNTFAFLNIKSPLTPDDGVRQCINYNPSVRLPTSIDDAARMSFAWLNGEKNITQRLIPCKYAAKEEFTPNSLVPVIYDTNEAFCGGSTNITLAEKFALELSALNESGVSDVLYLMNKGEINMYGSRDYLLSHFFNIDVMNSSDGMSVFYMYYDTFIDRVLKYIEHSKSVEFRVYRPQGPSLDIGVLILWCIAIFCVTFGGIWTAYETWTGLNKKKIEQERAKIQGRNPDISNSTPRSPSPNHAVSADSSNGEVIEGLDASNLSSNSGNVKPAKKEKPNEAELADLSIYSQCCVVFCLLVFIVPILMLSFTFRTPAVTLFNILCLIIGGPCIHHCIYGLIQLIFSSNRSLGAHNFDIELFSLAQVLCINKYVNIVDGQSTQSDEDRRVVEKLANLPFFSKKFRLLSSLLYCSCVAFTIYWYCVRNDAYAFLMLDFINICVCIKLIKGSFCYTLRFLTFLLTAMFVYDMFMVFGTRHLTSSGCSVMVQVATGVDCSSSKRDASEYASFYSVAPMEMTKSPEKIPFAFTVPTLSDPLGECYDSSVEITFNMLMLGLGDVLFPGYLISYCFHVDVLRQHRFFIFGVVSLIGYALGLISTFIALQFMETAQPALIYLVPFTLLPIFLLAWQKGIFRMMWLGRNLMIDEVKKDTRITMNS